MENTNTVDYSCIQRKDFPYDFWNYGLNPVTGERASYPVRRVDTKLKDAPKWG